MGTKVKVLLTADVEKLGDAGEIKEVSGGFGRNYLIPRGLAVLATKGQIKQAEERASAIKRRALVQRQASETLAGKLNGITVRFVERVGDEGRLYGSVTNSDIALQLKEQAGVEVDRRRIDLEDPIKRIGAYAVKIHVDSGIDALINVVVDAE